MVTDIGRSECVREKGERKGEWERKGRMPTVRGNKNGSVNVRARRSPASEIVRTNILDAISLEGKTMEQVKSQVTDCQLIKVEIL